MNQQYFIGIDPGKNTGMAVYDKKEKRLLSVESVAIHVCFQKVILFVKKYGRSNVFIRIEDARLRTWFGDSGPEKWKGAGSIMRDCTIWEDFLKDLGASFELVAPRRNKTKTDASFFKKATGWIGRTNEHARDAAMLVYGF